MRPSLAVLRGVTLTLVDASGRQARFLVDAVDDHSLLCSHVFGAERDPGLTLDKGRALSFGAPVGNAWAKGTGRVLERRAVGRVHLAIDVLDVEQRRAAYRETTIVPFLLGLAGEERPRRGRTANLSTGGMAARVTGRPVEAGRTGLVRLDLAKGEPLEAQVVKIAGDIDQRFRFIDLAPGDEDRIARAVRATELSRRRGRFG